MPLDQSQQLLLVEWMAGKNIQTQCPACNTTHEWSPGNIVSASVFTPGGLRLGSDVTPMVEIICDNCGHIRFFAAAPIGLYQKRTRPNDCENGERHPRKSKSDESFTISA